MVAVATKQVLKATCESKPEGPNKGTPALICVLEFVYKSKSFHNVVGKMESAFMWPRLNKALYCGAGEVAALSKTKWSSQLSWKTQSYTESREG